MQRTLRVSSEAFPDLLKARGDVYAPLVDIATSRERLQAL
jgi:hypothetical protein